MKITDAIKLFRYHQNSNVKQRTVRSYIYLLLRFEEVYSEREVESINPDEILQFLKGLTGDTAKSTRQLRYSQIKTFFIFVIDECNLNIKNPCNTLMLTVSNIFKPCLKLQHYKW